MLQDLLVLHFHNKSVAREVVPGEDVRQDVEERPETLSWVEEAGARVPSLPVVAKPPAALQRTETARPRGRGVKP